VPTVSEIGYVGVFIQISIGKLIPYMNKIENVLCVLLKQHVHYYAIVYYSDYCRSGREERKRFGFMWLFCVGTNLA
jgi:hypothetical protein